MVEGALVAFEVPKWFSLKTTNEGTTGWWSATFDKKQKILIRPPPGGELKCRVASFCSE